MLKKVLRILATSGPIPRLFRPLMNGRATIFMFHRFRDPAMGVEGHAPDLLHSVLQGLRREGLKPVSIGELIGTAKEGGDLSRMVAFTVDDGYADFHRVAAPIFAHHRCPVTVFLPTEFLDRKTWLWPDRVRFMMDSTSVTSVRVEVGGAVKGFEWQNAQENAAAARGLTWFLVAMTAGQRATALQDLEERLDVRVPDQLPPQFLPMTWEEVREDSKRGATFGPHSVSHPNIAFADENELEFEVSQSWERVRSETEAGTPVFCFPFGRAEDCPKTAGSFLASVGLIGSVTAVPGYVTGSVGRDAPFLLPRFAWPDDRRDLRQVLHGMEYAKALLRSRGRSEDPSASSP